MINLRPKFKRHGDHFVEADPYDATVVLAWIAICGMLAVSLIVGAAVMGLL